MSERKTPSILVAESDDLMRWALAERLSVEPCEVWEGADPGSTLTLLRKAPDLAIVDVGLLRAAADLEDALVAFSGEHRLLLLYSDRSDVPLRLEKAANTTVLEKPLTLDRVADFVK